MPNMEAGVGCMWRWYAPHVDLLLLTATVSELPASDPLAIVVLTVALLAVGIFACWLPARRAASLEPMQALRSD
jgi:ABC-type lipoprotein release transport system permease subunit